MTAAFYAAYFNLETTPITVAILRFNTHPLAGSNQPDLLEFSKGDKLQIEPKDIQRTIYDYILSFKDSLDKVSLFLDDCSGLKALEWEYNLYIKWVEREGDLEDQIKQYRGILYNPRPKIGSFEFTNIHQFLIESNLMFPEQTAISLIDPIETDEQKEMPYTEALLVLCKGIESYLKYTPSFSVIPRRY